MCDIWRRSAFSNDNRTCSASKFFQFQLKTFKGAFDFANFGALEGELQFESQKSSSSLRKNLLLEFIISLLKSSY